MKFSVNRSVAIVLSGSLLSVPKGWAFLIVPPFHNDACRHRACSRDVFIRDKSNRKHVGLIQVTSFKQSLDSDDDINDSAKSDGNPTDGSAYENVDFAFSDCDEEGECEIDWDLMPVFNDMDEENEANSFDDKADESNSETVMPIATSMEENLNDDSDEDDDNDDSLLEMNDDDMESFADELRTRFEMQWKMTERSEECDVYKPISCGGTICQTCHGKGSCLCRFCRGTGYIYMKLPSALRSMPGSRGEQLHRQLEESIFGGTLNSLLQDEPSSAFTACSICEQKGHETCRHCQGSGWIADWTSININSGLNP